MNKQTLILNHKILSHELNQLLNEWDFIGVVEKDNQNEYLDLIAPIISKLQEDISNEELQLYLRVYITDTYGYTPRNTDSFASKLLNWWKEKNESYK